MLSNGITFLLQLGTIYAGYEAYHTSDRQTVVLAATAGLVFSIFLRALAGRFSKKEVSSFRVLIGDVNSVLSKIILPMAVFYGALKRAGGTIYQRSYGIIQIDPAITIRGRDVSHLYPALVGVNFGFLAGQVVGKGISHFFKA
jgi:hypothetical protein